MSTTSKRVKVKGHYRVIERDDKGRIVSSKKWSPKPEPEQCPRCKHFTLEKYSGEPAPGCKLWVCKRCGFKSIRKINRKTET